MNNSVSTANVPAKIRPQNHPNTSLEHYSYTDLLSYSNVKQTVNKKRYRDTTHTFTYTTDLDYVTLEIKSTVALQTSAGC